MATTTGGLAAKQQEQQELKNPAEVTQMQKFVLSMKSQIDKALPSILTPERFTRMVMTALSNNPRLTQCTPNSFVGAMMQAAQLGLEPNTPLGQAYLIPYWSSKKKCYECQFQIGYKGLIDLAYRSGQVRDIQAHEVYEQDEFTYELGLNPKLCHKPALIGGRTKKIIGYYAVFHTKDGGYGFEIMSKEDVEEHARQYSEAYKNDKQTPWKTNFDEMAKKTVLKKCLKYAPLSTEFVRSLTADESIKSIISKNMLEVNNEMDYIDTNAEPVPENTEKLQQPMPKTPAVDMMTGEVLQEQPMSEDDRILEDSLNI